MSTTKTGKRRTKNGPSFFSYKNRPDYVRNDILKIKKTVFVVGGNEDE